VEEEYKPILTVEQQARNVENKPGFDKETRDAIDEGIYVYS